MNEYTDLTGEDLLDAVIKGKPYNAHLVAGNGLAWGVEHAAEQYHTTVEVVLDAIKFYLDNREEIDRLSEEAWNDPRILRGEARKLEMQRRLAIYRAKQEKSAEEA